LRLRHRDGGYRWFLTRGEALRDAAGKPYRMIGGLTDIDARKRSEETLARTQAQLTSMIDSAMDAIITVDDRMRIVGFNLSASRLFNCKREDAIGLALEGFIPTRYRGEHEGQMRAFAESGATKRSMGHGAEVTAVRADGTEFAADISISSYIGSGHRFYTAIIRDITQRKLSEAMVKQGLIDLAAAKEAAEVANRSKSAFLANMSHELRTPLNAIIGFAEVIAKGGGGLGAQKSAEYANDIVESGRHLLAVLGDILDMSKIEAGRYRLHPQPVALAAIIKAALAIAGGLAKERDIIVESHIAPNLPPIEADERALKQVLLNLLSNAVKFNRPGGRIDMRLDLLASGEQEIRVADTGIGIAAEALEHLFQPFQQVDSGLTRRNEGTGLGLWISLQFVKMHGGTLHLESAPGIGTTAVLRLPVGHKPNQDNTIGPSITPPP
ncbi:MAG: PAS domain S-box protein, partial [Alphaproteobacteria bacterium]|nr:PAS domain S-box protein [Alphaproteobacteria bacterium]